jgi:D-threonine aldolase
MSSDPQWYTISNTESLDTPAVVIYLDRVKQNIKTLVDSIDDVSRLRPHIKTHKSPEVTQLMLDSGIKKFKCATIAEAEMLAMIEAPDVLLAYQPVGPKANRLAGLIKMYPNTKFSCLIDNEESATHLSNVFLAAGLIGNVFVDLNVGMNRTGIAPEEAFSLYAFCENLKGISIDGLHAYDGHIRDIDFNVRSKRCDEGFTRVKMLQQKIFDAKGKKLVTVAGGTPTYSVHSKRKEIECSPGTFAYWDKGYQQILLEQKFIPAALVVTRIVSKPAPGILCVDLGHKAIASENPLSDRASFLNAPDVKPIGHSEEHMVLTTDHDEAFKVGDILYGLPYHVCPTVALHDQTSIVENHAISKQWETLSRNRRITI